MTFVQRHAYRIGTSFAAFLWPFFAKRRRLSMDNILKCGITDDRQEAKRIAKKAWCHLAGHVMEALCVPGVVNASNWREHLDFGSADPDAVRLLLDTPDVPILLVSGHHGVWEAATNILSFARPMIAIARTMNNRFVADWMRNHHFRGPVTVVDKKNGITKAVLEKWERDRAAMTILMDQHDSKGAMLEFMGRKAKTITSAARLAIRSGRPVVVGSFVRIAPYRYRLVGGAPLAFPKDANREFAAQLLNDRIAEAVRQYPEQYLWAHRRWRYD